VRGRYPDGGAFQLDVLLLADRHTPAIALGLRDVPTIDLLKTASFYAAHGASPRCLDILIEVGVQRATEVLGNLVPMRPVVPADDTLSLLREALRDCIPAAAQVAAGRYTGAGCALGFEQVRVHAFDTRVSTQHSSATDAIEQARQDAGQAANLVVTDINNRRMWMRFFMGLDPQGEFTNTPFPPEMIEQLGDYYNGDEAVLAHVLRVHRRMRDRVQRRAHKLGLARAEWVAEQMIQTSRGLTSFGRGALARSLFDVQSDATNYYAMLRMLAPYADRADSPCRADLPGARTPGCAIVYAGAMHVDHIQRALVRMQGYGHASDMVMAIVTKARRTNSARASKTTSVDDIDLQDLQDLQDDDRSCETIGELLAQMGLRPPQSPTTTTVRQLQAQLRARGLPVSGRKVELQTRLDGRASPARRPSPRRKTPVRRARRAALSKANRARASPTRRQRAPPPPKRQPRPRPAARRSAARGRR